MSQTSNETKSSLYEFEINNIDSEPTHISDYKGQVLLIVNVASKCGLTPQYAELEKLYNSYKDQGFVVLGFPANNFNNQEPGTNLEIKQFCTTNYDVTFSIFSKISVKGENSHPLYQWLIQNSDRHDDIEWNFTKFLISRDGRVLQRFAPQTEPGSPEIISAIENALEEKP